MIFCKRLNTEMISRIYQDLSYLIDGEFYGEIFNTISHNNTDELGFE